MNNKNSIHRSGQNLQLKKTYILAAVLHMLIAVYKYENRTNNANFIYLFNSEDCFTNVKYFMWYKPKTIVHQTRSTWRCVGQKKWFFLPNRTPIVHCLMIIYLNDYLSCDSFVNFHFPWDKLLENDLLCFFSAECQDFFFIKCEILC